MVKIAAALAVVGALLAGLAATASGKTQPMQRGSALASYHKQHGQGSLAAKNEKSRSHSGFGGPGHSGGPGYGSGGHGQPGPIAGADPYRCRAGSHPAGYRQRPRVPYTTSAVDLQSNGYTEKEYFVSGTAQAYNESGTWGTDGQWDVTPSTTSPYKTRFIVRRPVDMSKFSGTVVVEWLNATSGRDLDVGWTFAHNEMMHNGDIYVGVTTQGLPITSPTGLIAWDPQRYGTLSIPDDEYSYDIFSQVGKALLSPQYAGVLGGARPKELLALRRLSVGQPSRDLRQRDPADRQDLQRLPHQQPQRQGSGAQRHADPRQTNRPFELIPTRR